jgi:adenosine deaminase
VNLIMSINRHEPIPIGQRTAQLASQYQGMIAGLDLSGDEAGFSARPFGPMFHQARKAGLGITAHAGEWRGPESIRETIKHLRVDRIGHGVRVVEDLETVRQIKARGITLEVCPTSNIQSGAVGSADRHPLKQLLDLGLPVTIGTDDPSVSGITLTDEYVLAMNELGLTPDDLKQVILNAVSAAFLPAGERASLAKYVQHELAAY